MTRAVAIVLGAIVVGLVGWTGYLGWSLPERYEARNWNLVWVGFDGALIAVLGYAAWVAWFRRQIMVVTALIAGTLLLCDAWFDVVTSFGNRDAWLTMLTAAGGELPAALFFFWVARRILTQVVTTVHSLSGLGGPIPRLRDSGALHARDEHTAESGDLADEMTAAMATAPTRGDSGTGPAA